jgi:Fur family ferric uptake transcriptional regulator
MKKGWDLSPNTEIDWALVLRNKGLRATQNAVAVLRLLSTLKLPYSHDEIHLALTEQTTKDEIDPVTLYRILDRLHQVGLIEKSLGSDRIWRFRSSNKNALEYFECDSCHQHFHLPAQSPLLEILKKLNSQLKSQAVADFAISLSVQGKCKDCKSHA